MENPPTLVREPVAPGVHEPVPPRGIEVDRGTVLAAVGLLGVALGALGPWATFSVFSLSGYRTEDGKAILAAAGFALAALLLGRMNLVSRTAAILAMILAGYAAAHDGVEIAVGASFARVQGSQLAFADWGTYAIVVGAAFVIVGLVLRFNFWIRVLLIVLALAAATVSFYWIEHPPTWAQHGGPVLH
jgi:hypothetical protein